MRKEGAKTVHHCECGRSVCDKHTSYCPRDKVTYYTRGGCGPCNNRAKMEAQREAQAKRAAKEKEAKDAKEKADADWYAGK